MSKILMEYNDKDGYIFASIINDINQIAKNFKSTNEYSINNGKVYAYKTLFNDIAHQVMEYDVSSNRNKKAFNDGIEYLNGIVNGKELYNFYKEFKSDICKVLLYDDHFIIGTSNSKISYTSSILDKYVDCLKLDDYLARLNACKFYKEIYRDEEFDKVIDENNVMKRENPYMCKFPIKRKDGKSYTVKFRIVKKLFPTYKQTSSVKLYLSKLLPKNKSYAIRYVISDKNVTIVNYVNIINY